MTPNFSLAELTASPTARAKRIDNTPPSEVLPALQRTAEGLEKIRSKINAPVRTTSCYRSPMLNKIVGGSAQSQHLKGEAADIIAPQFGTAYDLAVIIAKNMIELGVDQVIREKNSKGAEWVHVSFAEKPRHMALSLTDKGWVSGIV
jgi:zinc D-Ala-D-Ala carboxypeptidase